MCLDVANGYTEAFVDHVRKVREHHPRAIIVAGIAVVPHAVHGHLLNLFFRQRCDWRNDRGTYHIRGRCSEGSFLCIKFTPLTLYIFIYESFNGRSELVQVCFFALMLPVVSLVCNESLFKGLYAQQEDKLA